MSIDTIDQAITLARRFHGTQMYGDQPYVDGHLIPVASMAVRLAEAGIEGGPMDVSLVGIVAALHDVLEDTAATAHELAKCGVPDEAIGAIQFLTEPPVADGHHALGQARADYIRSAMSAGPVARLVKLADNLVNSDPAGLDKLAAARGFRLSAKYHADRQTMALWRAEEQVR